ncbi:MAG: hypothetical protein JEY71_17695, partial [Sphaerochaeta sp.]|nr:hypothetical protein [Sphaerochaeta sp.]
LNRPVPNGMPGGVRGWGREAPAYSIAPRGSRISPCFPGTRSVMEPW